MKNKSVMEHFKKKSPSEKSKNPCWKGYKMVGMKEKNGKNVPNCVPSKK